MNAKLMVIRTRILNELGAAQCTQFAVTEIGPARLDMDAIHEAALREDRAYTAFRVLIGR